MLKLTENQKAFALLVWFIVAFGCAGNGDYEYAKSREVVTHEKMCKQVIYMKDEKTAMGHCPA